MESERPGDQQLHQLQAVVSELITARGSVRVLEAGCGSLNHLELGDGAYIVGIDISEIALERNQGLDERILGDVETYQFDEGSFDVVVCWYVFEHLPHPERAMARFAHALRPGGMIILALPNVFSVKGLITKFTPFRFHVWVRRRLLGRPHAGTPGHGPYPTFLPFSVAPGALARNASQHGLAVRFFDTFEDGKQVEIRRKFKITGRRWRFVQKLTEAVTLGRLETARSECVMVLQA